MMPKPTSTHISSLFDTTRLSKDSVAILNSFDEIIQGVHPLNSRQLQQLPEHIRNLSHQLTDDRASRRLGYMNDNIQQTAYVWTWEAALSQLLLPSGWPARN